MEAKTDAADFTALEIQEESADMARRSVAYNHLEDKIKVVTGDIRDMLQIFLEHLLFMSSQQTRRI